MGTDETATPAPPPADQPALVDLHCHVLPGVDDGPAGDREALALLAALVRDGIGRIVATPHADRTDAARIERGVRRLNELARDRQLPVTVLAGSEVRLTADTPARFAAAELVTINGSSYLLLELPLNASWPPNLQAVISALRFAGATPILAHAERYPAVRRHPELIAELVANEVLIQLNAASLLPGGSKHRRETAELLLRSRLAHVIATDAHDAERRPPLLTPALARAATLAGAEYAAWMTQTATDIVAGRPVILPRPQLEVASGSGWSRWWRRASRRSS